LEHEIIVVAIDDHAGKPVALAPRDPTKVWIDTSSRSVFGGLCDAAIKEVQIEILFPPREAPRHDLRFRVVNRAADQMILTVFKRDDIAVRRFPENFQHFARKHPVVAV
jgi:hypothetical protein